MDEDELIQRVSARLTAAEVVDLLDITVEEIYWGVTISPRRLKLLKEEVSFEDDEVDYDDE
jgi:hypothetical protein